MATVDPGTQANPSRASLYDVDSADPLSQLVDRTSLSEEEVREISDVMAALGELREAENRLSDASLRYMKLNATDMRALHFLIICSNTGAIATPGGIAHHLGISTASTTKLLDRLERAGHIIRHKHPTDRRALAISITPETHTAAMQTVGAQHAKRFHAAARLTSSERRIVAAFLRDMAQEITLKDEAWAQPAE